MSGNKSPKCPSSGSGTGSSSTSATKPCLHPDCCCCVSSLSIQNLAQINTSNQMGHRFNTVIGLSYTGTGSKKSCVLEWWEKVNIPAIPGHPPNTWTDMYVLMGGGSFGTWTSRSEPCPGNETVTDTDPPALGRRPGRTVTRTLEFRIVVKSGTGCACGNASLQLTAKQVLVMINGNPDWANSSFTTP